MSLDNEILEGFRKIQQEFDKDSLESIIENVFDIKYPTDEQKELIQTIKYSIRRLEELK